MLYLKSYQGLGNEYFLVDPRRSVWGQSAEKLQLALSRNFGLCADGILIGPAPDTEGWSLRIFNPDGSEAACGGNAIMIFARYLADAGYVTADNLSVRVGAGEIPVRFLDAAREQICITLPAASFFAEDIPVRGAEGELVDTELSFGAQSLRVSCVQNGTPHCVLLLPEINRTLACDLGERIQESGRFPEGVNVVLMQLVDERNLKLEFFERGAGYITSSGSCAAAAASVAGRLGLCAAELQLHMPGGTMGAQLLPDGRVALTSRVSAVRSQTYSDDEIRAALSL